MLSNYLKIAFRNMKKSKILTLINLSGLSIGMTCCILLILYINSELSIDNYHAKGDRIYRLCINGNFGDNQFLGSASNATAAKALKEEYPEVLNTVRFGRKPGSMAEYNNQKFFIKSMLYSDESVFDIFSWPMIMGDPSTALAAPYSIVISEEVARKMFAETEPVGKVLKLNQEENYTITGVIKNIPENSHFTFDALCSFSTLYVQEAAVSHILTDWLSHNFRTYLLLRENFEYRELEKKFPALIDRYGGEQLKAKGGTEKLFLQPLKDIYLRPLGQTIGPIYYVYIFSAIALIILLIACVNFMNLSTAYSIKRAKEVGMRKVLGSFRTNIVYQFIGETLIISVLSFLIAVLLAELILPHINTLIGRELQRSFTTLTWLIPGALGLILFTGITAGSYPAFLLSKFQPIDILKGKQIAPDSKLRLRSVLVVVQFSISIILIIGTGLIINQLDYLKNKDVGFNKEHVVVIRTSDIDIHTFLSSIKTEFKSHPGVISVTSSSSIPGWGAPNNAKIPEGYTESEMQLMDEINVDQDFIPTYGIEIVEGRNFYQDYSADEKHSILINQTAVNKYGWENPIGKIIKAIDPDDTDNWEPKTVIGVVKDFHIRPLYREITPLFIGNDPEYPFAYNKTDIISVKIRPENISGTINFLENKWTEIVPASPFKYRFLDDTFNRQFIRMEQSRNIYSYFTFLAIFIACLGLFGIAAFSVEQKTKEIGIRKVLGSTVTGIVVLLGKQLILLIIIATVIACPLAYFLFSEWLQNFPYRTTITIYTFLIPTLLVISIGIITISTQAIRAAVANPVEALRYE